MMRMRRHHVFLLVAGVCVVLIWSQKGNTDRPIRQDRDIIRTLPLVKLVGDTPLLLVEGVDGIPLYVYRPPTCERERVNIVYVKTHKTASTTTVNILHSFGIRRNLTFLLPNPWRYTLCHPYRFDHSCFRTPKTTPVNIVCQHMVFNDSVVSGIMPHDSVYITNTRDPFARMKSAFNYYAVRDRLRLQNGSDDAILEYLRDIPKYEARYTSQPVIDRPGIKKCLGNFSFTHNAMAYDLGLPTGFQVETTDQTRNDSYIRRWIDALQRRFALVIVSEYFDESLVLMRRLMCWKLTDLLYIQRNVKEYDGKGEQIDQTLLANFRRHNEPEYVLYDHFNKTLWRRVADEKVDFWDELRAFKRLISDVSAFCLNAQGDDVHSFIASTWNEEFVLSLAECKTMSTGQYENLVQAYNANPVKVTRGTNDVPGC